MTLDRNQTMTIPDTRIAVPVDETQLFNKTQPFHETAIPLDLFFIDQRYVPLEENINVIGVRAIYPDPATLWTRDGNRRVFECDANNYGRETTRTIQKHYKKSYNPSY